jgi:hypothetical protein
VTIRPVGAEVVPASGATQGRPDASACTASLNLMCPINLAAALWPFTHRQESSVLRHISDPHTNSLGLRICGNWQTLGGPGDRMGHILPMPNEAASIPDWELHVRIGSPGHRNVHEPKYGHQLAHECLHIGSWRTNARSAPEEGPM